MDDNNSELKKYYSLHTDDVFESLVIKIVDMNRQKRADYASKENVFQNFDTNARMMNLSGYTALEDCLSMVTRKIGRITNLRGRDPLNETVYDSFLDLAVYAVLLLGLQVRDMEAFTDESPLLELSEQTYPIDNDFDPYVEDREDPREGLPIK
jgi:hypothetical protein